MYTFIVWFPLYEAQEQANESWCWKSAKWLFGWGIAWKEHEKSTMEIFFMLIGVAFVLVYIYVCQNTSYCTVKNCALTVYKPYPQNKMFNNSG